MLIYKLQFLVLFKVQFKKKIYCSIKTILLLRANMFAYIYIYVYLQVQQSRNVAISELNKIYTVLLIGKNIAIILNLCLSLFILKEIANGSAKFIAFNLVLFSILERKKKFSFINRIFIIYKFSISLRMALEETS